jgi:hypothetical protein
MIAQAEADAEINLNVHFIRAAGEIISRARP